MDIGKEVAKFVEKYFVNYFLNDIAFREGMMEQALKNTFLKMDELLESENGKKEVLEIKRMETNDGEKSIAGCTATVVVLYKGLSSF